MSQTRSEFGARVHLFVRCFAHRAWKPRTSSSLRRKSALAMSYCSLRSRRPALRASLAQHGGARFPMLAARWRDPANIRRFRPMW
jgi:hypothetical protein